GDRGGKCYACLAGDDPVRRLGRRAETAVPEEPQDQFRGVLLVRGEEMGDAVTKAECRSCQEDGGKRNRQCGEREDASRRPPVRGDLGAKVLGTLGEAARRQIAQRWDRELGAHCSKASSTLCVSGCSGPTARSSSSSDRRARERRERTV